MRTASAGEKLPRDYIITLYTTQQFYPAESAISTGGYSSAPPTHPPLGRAYIHERRIDVTRYFIHIYILSAGTRRASWRLREYTSSGAHGVNERGPRGVACCLIDAVDGRAGIRRDNPVVIVCYTCYLGPLRALDKTAE